MKGNIILRYSPGRWLYWTGEGWDIDRAKAKIYLSKRELNRLLKQCPKGMCNVGQA